MQIQRQTAGFSNAQGSAGGSPLDGYQPLPGVYDEYLNPSGAVREHWQGFSNHVRQVGARELERRWNRSQRLIYENAVAYTPHGDGRPRPWQLDPIPLLLSNAEWRKVSEGVQQRAKLLDLVLRDLFGPQELIKSGVLPPGLLYKHPGYLLPLLRTAHGKQQPQNGGDTALPEQPSRMLTFYAADLGRSPDGSWWVLADRTESPSGVGFALENRIVVSRMLAEPFRDCRVHRLAGYFARVREVMEALAPHQVRNPSIAILSHGPSQPNFFEDAYLARYLGYMLVEGEDLTVRQRGLWLKTLEGLMPVDVVLRRPNSNLCDPLELDPQSRVGIAGLTQAQREGHLALVNALGSGVVESPVFMAFLPRLCQRLLGEPLKLPGVATWWCGEPESLEYVLANLDRLLLKRAFRTRGEESLITAKLGELSHEELAKQIRSDPASFVGQERVRRSSAPRWLNGKLHSAHIALRVYAAATDNTCSVMHGALARTTSASESLEASSLKGEGSKDVWVLSDEPVAPITLLSDDDEPIALVRVGAELPSRVADNSYWLGRHLERAHSKARVVRTTALRLTGENDLDELPELPQLLRLLAEQGLIEPGYVVKGMRELLPHVDRTLPSQVLGRNVPSSITATVDSVFYTSTKVRERLSRDTWRIILRIVDAFPSNDDRELDLTELITVMDDLIVDLSAVGGQVVESMTRTQFYRFLDIGRRIERAIQLVDLFNVCLTREGPVVRPLLEAILESSDSLMTYRSRYRANLRFVAVLDLLLTDPTNPRSLAFQLLTLERHLGKLPRSDEEPAGSNEQKRILAMTHAVKMADVQRLAELHELGDAKPLADFLGVFSKGLPALSDAIAMKYLVHAEAPRLLSPM